jgi:hypothetical protein
MLTYDPDQKRYRGWWFSSNGQPGEYTGEWDEASQTMTMTVPGTAPATLVLKNHFVDDDHTKWSFVAKDGAGKTVLHFNVRVKTSKK